MDEQKKNLKPARLDGRKDDLAPGLSRRSFFAAAGAAGVGSAASLLSSTSAQAQSTDWLQPGNNSHVIDLQNTSVFTDGEVKIDFYGHCAFKVTSPGGASILFDPWRDDPSGAWGLWFKQKFPETLVDITMSTHTHFDHDAIDRPQSTMVLDRMVGTFEFADLKITGYADKHACVAPGLVSLDRCIGGIRRRGLPAEQSRTYGHGDLCGGDRRHPHSDLGRQPAGPRRRVLGGNRPDRCAYPASGWLRTYTFV